VTDHSLRQRHHIYTPVADWAAVAAIVTTGKRNGIRSVTTRTGNDDFFEYDTHLVGQPSQAVLQLVVQPELQLSSQSLNVQPVLQLAVERKW
jgi:hypothetical protein